MSTVSILLTIIASFIVGTSTLLIKKSHDFDHRLNRFLIAGIGLFGLGNFLFIFALRNMDLSIIFPLSSVQYIFAALLATVLLKEKISVMIITGTVCIMIGSFLIFL